MLFRNGGRVPKGAEVVIEEEKIKITNEFKYLRITLQPTDRNFARHITERTTLAIKEMNDISHIKQLSLDTAMQLFKAEILPILCYGIKVMWEQLTVKNLADIEKIKATYLKKALGVAKTSPFHLVPRRRNQVALSTTIDKCHTSAPMLTSREKEGHL